MADASYDENTFLCGYQRIRRYGSFQDLNSPSTSGARKYSRVVQHKVEPSDTLQSIQLRYNSSLFEIKRMNRLWSNDSIYCRTHLSIPIYDDSPSSTRSLPEAPPGLPSSSSSRPVSCTGGPSERKSSQPETEKGESVHDFFKRIDQNVRRTKKVVRKMNRVAE